MAVAPGPRWFSANPSRRWTEKFFLSFSVVWILCFGAVVVTEVYKQFADPQYLLLGLAVSTPFALIPLITGGPESEKGVPFFQRNWVKANVWVAIFSYVGNYFWTHYFYQVLGTSYTFPVAWQLNAVPFFLYLITHAYFCFYFTFSTLFLRRIRTTSWFVEQNLFVRGAVVATAVLFLSVATAFGETWTIAGVPYYSHTDKFLMYTVGSLFYGTYFIVSFPMYYELDEDIRQPKWTLAGTIVNAMGCSMIVFIILDIWRLLLNHYGIAQSAVAFIG